MINKEIMDALCFLHSLARKDTEFETQYEAFKQVLDYIEELEAQVQNKWIPCSEKMPEESLDSVMGWDTYRKRCVFVQYYCGRWILGDDESVNIVAWKPLPEPYKEGDD